MKIESFQNIGKYCTFRHVKQQREFCTYRFVYFGLSVYFDVFSIDFKALWAQTDESLLHNALKIKTVFNFDFALASLVLSLVVKLYRSVQQWPCLA